MRDRRDFLIAALVAALIFCAGMLVGEHGDVLPTAAAQGFDPEQPVPGGNAPGTPGTPFPGVNINPDPGVRPNGVGRSSSVTASDSNSNNRFVAVTAPIGSGESVLFLIDSKTEQLALYRYVRRKGLEFLAGRKIDYDLRILGYQDVSKHTRNEMAKMYHENLAQAAAKSAKKKK